MLSPGRTLPICAWPRDPSSWHSLAQGGSPVASLPYFESDASISDMGQWFFSREVKSFTEKSDICGQDSPRWHGKVGKNRIAGLFHREPSQGLPLVASSECFLLQRKVAPQMGVFAATIAPKNETLSLCGLLSTVVLTQLHLPLPWALRSRLYSQGIFSKVIKLLFMYLFIFKLAGWLAGS